MKCLECGTLIPNPFAKGYSRNRKINECFSCRNPTITADQLLNTLLNELQLAKEEINIIAFSFAIDDGQGRILPTNAANQVAQKLIAIKKLRLTNDVLSDCIKLIEKQKSFP